jgi:hypothetical protein
MSTNGWIHIDRHPRFVMRTCVLAGIAIAAFTLGAVKTGAAQTADRESAAPRGVTGFLHVGGVAGLGLLTSSDITGLLSDEFGISISEELSLMARAGFKNFLQIEYRRTDGAHNFLNNQLVNGQFQTIAKIPMDYDVNEFIAKLNPFGFSSNSPTGWFITVGRSEIDWLDTEGDGFSGSGLILGLEFGILQRWTSTQIGLVHHSIDFDEATLLGMTFTSDISAGNWILYVSVGIGPGF